ncbi:hypothetical protein [uncultured Pseudomonas sp.]|uniref:hypothetical protein n=1 Tax=uncultured Pseudomonas sp. TaxID=114707 RepID=UPI0025EB3C70|nr:hypothetical protein [uncultured Pseudomonas sp.]
MNLRLPMFLMLCFTFSNALAAACDVYTHSQSDQVPVVEQHTCYTYEGVPSDAIDWSCSNENKDMMNTKKTKIAQCAGDYTASCKATLTQEALANPHATAKVPGHAGAMLPSNAGVVTYHYAAQELKQAKIDCEKDGGQWTWQSTQ